TPQRDVVTPTVPPVTFAPKDRQRVTNDAGCQQFPSITPDGKAIVYEEVQGDTSHVVTLDMKTRTRREITKGPDADHAPALSPDGHMVAFLRGATTPEAYVVPFDASSPPRKIAPGGVHPSFSHDGTAVWAGAVEKPIR